MAEVPRPKLNPQPTDNQMSNSKLNSNTKFAIVVGRFYPELADRLINGAQRAFTESGVGKADIHDVSGAFELPLAAQFAAQSGRYAGIACFAAVIRGETDHYDYVCSEAARGIQDVQLRTGVPCSFGVLTVHNMQQALDRSGDKYDRGYDWAIAAVRMVELKQRLIGETVGA